MKRSVVVSLEHRFYRYNGTVYTGLAFDYAYWTRYLEQFERVIVFARVRDVDQLESHYRLAEGDKVSFANATHYRGPAEFFLKLPILLVRAFVVAYTENRFLLRSGNVTNVLWLMLSLLRRRYIREFPGDIRAGIRHFVGQKKAVSLSIRMISAVSQSLAALQARRAIACSYVSESVRSLYPARDPDKEYVFSSVRLPPKDFRKTAYSIRDKTLRVVCVGRIENEKGHAYLVEALALVFAEESFDKIVLTLCGDGSQLQSIVSYSLAKGIDIIAPGTVTDPTALCRTICECDLFVLPSLTEGMPRALIEAMALGVPCVATRVGGVPEIMAYEDMVEPGVTNSLAVRIKELAHLNDDDRKAFAEKYRLLVRSKFAPEAMTSKMKEFWSTLDA